MEQDSTVRKRAENFGKSRTLILEILHLFGHQVRKVDEGLSGPRAVRTRSDIGASTL